VDTTLRPLPLLQKYHEAKTRVELQQQILDLMGFQNLVCPFALSDLTNKGYRVPPLFEPLITNGMVKQDAHEIVYFRLGGDRQAVSIDETQLLEPAF
jgi:hypothetical protein